MDIYKFFLIYLQLVLFFLQFLQAHSSGNHTDKLALLNFKAEIISDPDEILNSWNDSLPFCQWYGITCSRRHQRVTLMVLGDHNLIGSISPHIGNLSFLRILNLQNNGFNGRIPQEIGNLLRLQQLNLNNNMIEGDIPLNLTRCSRLKIIQLQRNNLTGKILTELDSLAMLEELRLSVNNLNGTIPPSLGNLSSLAILDAGRMELEGNIPHELGRFTELTFFNFEDNKLSGMIPLSIFNISSLRNISITQNKLSGILPRNIGITLPNLQQIRIGDNLFSGFIPNSFCNASQLEILEVVENNFVGQLPNCLGNLQRLQRLKVADNNLGYNTTSDMAFLTSLKNCSNMKILGFSSNNFGGVLPNSVANLSVQLNQLYFGGNQITGVIPEALENLINLISLDMRGNLLTGVIPSSLGKLRKLQLLDLGENRLSGKVPFTIGNITQLFKLTFSQNNLEGIIPISIRNCQNLLYLDISRNNFNGSIPKEILLPSLSLCLNLSRNSLTGSLPAEVGKLTNINKLDVSGNMLSGEIPVTIGSCSSLEYLYMQQNSFQGMIPSSLISLKGLQKLDISQNNLTGEIPKVLQSLIYLLYLNLSFNNLMGEIPSEGVFNNSSAISLIGNNKLCGGVPELHLPKCPTKEIGHDMLCGATSVFNQPKCPTKEIGHDMELRCANNRICFDESIAIKLVIIIPCVIFFILLMVSSVLAYQWRTSKRKSFVTPVEMDHIVKVSYKELYDATRGFSAHELIGSGSFGSVYKGFLNEIEGPVAIKVLNLGMNGASKSFMDECKVLGKVRHRNLAKLLTYCSSIDYKQNEFKALVYEFIGKGSLEKWLHHTRTNYKSRKLNFLRRLNIAIDVASALHYIHDLYEIPIIHCDLKPSNILIDDDMVAHLSDFGLAKLYTNDVSQSETSSVGIRGTIGYIPPEYGIGSTASKEGDVYSYGILILEMFTGKRPTDKIFKNYLTLHNFVKDALPERLVHITDPTLLPRGMEETQTTNSEIDEQAQTHAEAESSTNGNISRTSIAKEKDGLISVFKVGIACSAQSPKNRMKMRDVIKELHLLRSTFLGVRIFG
ncbi:probable LRR receptor-like serine/threonine-protein kinase At3g47570 [Manihot esculenta]|uniref:non-specific serine/threonine protein kinase n=1 Tax=Manihot esculenta TaxID=3983 RepID=A0A251KB23_MANES|nr:probable LRR receptor-like serine/threonine-protein kinase At3g47570 [Manihot esculenta]XP_021627309.1 probable LRR receptor-like serine/threonine-protein kinase At3g47570 [Manihot esculenta]OAY37704.1 hypothetical protein MANES_11G122200v8 [Manihot esculenta]OAY37705.1 hypothetical protein MANES_11G122200v8 [Manihot esculenta]